MFAIVEASHNDSFWKVYLENPGNPFEINLYYMHIHARKLETSSQSVYAKYRVLSAEREMTLAGLQPYLSYVWSIHAGLMEKCILALNDSDAIRPLARFFVQYGLALLRTEPGVHYHNLETFLKLTSDTVVMIACSSNVVEIRDLIANGTIDMK